MKRTVSFFAALALIAGLIAWPSAALSDNVKNEKREDVAFVLSHLKIMEGFPDGSFGYDSTLTRAQFSKICVMSSASRSSVSQVSKTSPFSDVPYTLWSASYIRAAQASGFVKGYSDGSFRPENAVLFEEAVTVALRLLGYKDEDIAGSYPYGQIALATSLSLTQNISKSAGSRISRQDAAYLIYNTLNTTPKGGAQPYYKTLGFDLDVAELTAKDIRGSETEGPFTYLSESSLSVVPMKTDGMKVYRDDRTSSLQGILKYDIFYYNVSENTIWAYGKKLTGTLESISPSRQSPASVTVGGKSYSLSSDTAKEAFGVDGIGTGEMVTLLLDRDGNAADGRPTSKIYEKQLGVVEKTGTKIFTGDKGDTTSSYVSVLLISGEKIDVKATSGEIYHVGGAVSVSYKDGAVTAAPASKDFTVSGLVSAADRKIGNISVAQDAAILEIDGQGDFSSVSLSRLDGLTLKSESLICAIKNSAGQADGLIIRNVTGDLGKYGMVTYASEKKSDGSQGSASSGSYRYDIGGVESSYSTSNGVLNVKAFPSVFTFENKQLESITPLPKVSDKIVSVTELFVETASGERLLLSDSVSVYRSESGSYSFVSLESAFSSASVSAYYDKAQQEGGRIRVLVISD